VARRMGKMPIKEAVSAGGVVSRFGEDGLEVVICGRSAEGIWGLPKGTPEANETLEQTACREVEEETGLKVKIVKTIGGIVYWFVREGVRYHKTVHYYLMDPIGGDLSAHDWEYDLVQWVSVDAALAALTFENDRETVRKAEKLLVDQSEQLRGDEVTS
jgi:8-oxo-dGTP pyrophosphatase MutT (NUDIX family)